MELQPWLKRGEGSAQCRQVRNEEACSLLSDWGPKGDQGTVRWLLVHGHFR